MALLTAKNINISFAGIQILHDVDFELHEGEINCLCGENGAGKSTLIKILMGIYPGYTGEIYVNDQLVKMENPRDAIKYGIYGVQQHRDLAPTLNAVENIFLGNEIFKGKGKQRYDYSKMTKISRKHISKFGVDINLNIPVSELKVSEQGIIAICKALIAKSKILLIDEASAPLDDSERVALYDSLQNLTKEGVGIVYITHHLDEVFRIGDSITVLRDGQNAAKMDTAEVDKEKLIASMTGNAQMYERETNTFVSQEDDFIFEVKELSCRGLSNINIGVRKGEILGIAGLEGSGKDLIAKCCFGFVPYDQGKIIKDGKIISPKTPIKAIKNNIGLVPNDRKHAGLVLCRDITDNIIVSRINKDNKKIVLGRWAAKTAKKYMDELRIKCASASQLVEYLSGGNQQKVLIAKWLETQVDILFMIEPTEGIDVGARSDLYGVFKELAKSGKAIIIATSDLDELLTLSDRILTMVEGKIVNEYEIESASKQTLLTDILSKVS